MSSPFSSRSPTCACWPRLGRRRAGCGARCGRAGTVAAPLMATASPTHAMPAACRLCAGASAFDPSLGSWERRCRRVGNAPDDEGANAVLLRLGVRGLPCVLCLPRDVIRPLCRTVSAARAVRRSTLVRAPQLRERLLLAPCAATRSARMRRKTRRACGAPPTIVENIGTLGFVIKRNLKPKILARRGMPRNPFLNKT